MALKSWSVRRPPGSENHREKWRERVISFAGLAKKWPNETLRCAASLHAAPYRAITERGKKDKRAGGLGWVRDKCSVRGRVDELVSAGFPRRGSERAFERTYGRVTSGFKLRPARRKFAAHPYGRRAVPKGSRDQPLTPTAGFFFMSARPIVLIFARAPFLPVRGVRPGQNVV